MMENPSDLFILLNFMPVLSIQFRKNIKNYLLYFLKSYIIGSILLKPHYSYFIKHISETVNSNKNSNKKTAITTLSILSFDLQPQV